MKNLQILLIDETSGFAEEYLIRIAKELLQLKKIGWFDSYGTFATRIKIKNNTLKEMYAPVCA